MYSAFFLVIALYNEIKVQMQRILFNRRTVAMMDGTVGALKLQLSCLSLRLYQRVERKVCSNYLSLS